MDSYVSIDEGKHFIHIKETKNRQGVHMGERRAAEHTGSGVGNLYHTFLKITLLPLLLSGIVIIAYSSVNLKGSMQSEMRQTLHDVAVSVLAAYDLKYEGDYNLLIDDENDKTLLRKGDAVLSGDYGLLDAISGQTDLEISLFFYDLRLMTTLYDIDGNRYIGNNLNKRVREDVLKTGQEHYYTNVEINNVIYYAYYIPVFGQDGTCIGMVGVAKPAIRVQRMLNGFLIRNLLIILLAILLTALFIAYFSSQIVSLIRRIMEFLREMSKGNLDKEMDHTVVRRADELGEMGRFIVKVQNALRKLIEKDPLTNLYNRRSGEKKMLDTIRKTKTSGGSFVLAFGDIDFFKKFNDTYGHDFGDVVLVETAKVLSDYIAGKGYVIRWGGEEFLVILQDCDMETARFHFDKLMDMIRKHEMQLGGQSAYITMTFGLTQSAGEEGLDELIKKADEKLYHGKESGRNRIYI